VLALAFFSSVKEAEMAQHITENDDASQLLSALPQYEQTLLELAQRDAARALENPDERAARSVALWMADQVATRAQRADLDPTFSRAMQEQAKRIREKVLSMAPSKVQKRW
jgi:hypothetical protein